MTTHTPFINLTTPADLRRKLRREFDKSCNNPVDQDCAFNLFITAHSMIDWVYSRDPDAKKTISSHPLLKLCSHIANGAKHLELDPNRHRSVSKTEAKGGVFNPRMFNSKVFNVPKLIVHLDT